MQKIWNTGGGPLYMVEIKDIDPEREDSLIYGSLIFKWDEQKDIEAFQRFIVNLSMQKPLIDIDLRIAPGLGPLERSIENGKAICRVGFMQPYLGTRPNTAI